MTNYRITRPDIKGNYRPPLAPLTQSHRYYYTCKIIAPSTHQHVWHQTCMCVLCAHHPDIGEAVARTPHRQSPPVCVRAYISACMIANTHARTSRPTTYLPLYRSERCTVRVRERQTLNRFHFRMCVRVGHRNLIRACVRTRVLSAYFTPTLDPSQSHCSGGCCGAHLMLL